MDSCDQVGPPARLLPGHIFDPGAVVQARLVARTGTASAITASLGELVWPMRLGVLDAA
jgi:hypothetical protein